MKVLKVIVFSFVFIFFLFSFCAKKNPEIYQSYHPEEWYKWHDNKIKKMETYEPCLECHSIEGESPFYKAPSCKSCHTELPEEP
jgi:uncharacterized paraquat-inducible protein A